MRICAESAGLFLCLTYIIATFLLVSVLDVLIFVENFLETACYLFSNFIPLMPLWHACGGHNVYRAVLGMWRERPRFHWIVLSTGPKEGSKKRARESLTCPLRSQNAIPAPYAKLPQQGPNNCDTVGIWFGPC